MSLICKANCGRGLKKPTECSACGGNFHSACGVLQSFTRISEYNSTVHTICSQCASKPEISPDLVLLKGRTTRSRSSSTSSKRSRSDSELDTDDENEEVERIKKGKKDFSNRDVMEAILRVNQQTKRARKDMRHKYKELTTKITAVSATVTKVSERVDLVEEAGKRSQEEITALKTQLKNQEKVTQALADKVSTMESSSITELRIAGHPSTTLPNQDLVQLTLDIALIANFSLISQDILTARVLPAKKKPTEHEAVSAPLTQSRPNVTKPAFIVVFRDSSLCSRFLAACSFPHRIHLPSTDTTNPGTRIYVSTLLKRDKVELFKKASEWKTMHNWLYVWHKKNVIYLGEADGKKPVKIVTEAQLSTLEERFKNTSLEAPSAETTHYTQDSSNAMSTIINTGQMQTTPQALATSSNSFPDVPSVATKPPILSDSTILPTEPMQL